MKHWIQITSGQGPEECCHAVVRITKILMTEAKNFGLTIDIIEESLKNGDSVLLSIQGDKTLFFINQWRGSILWICKSPFRPTHKRKNWYIGIEHFFYEERDTTLKLTDITITSMKSGGPGGQHVNTTDSAVRVTHNPTGLSAKASEERSQHMNKKLALARLASQLQNCELDNKKNVQNQQWKQHQDLERGNPIKTYVGEDFKERKR